MQIPSRLRSRIFVAVAALLIVLASIVAAAVRSGSSGIDLAGPLARAAEIAGMRKVGLEPGNYAPDFTLESVDGNVVSLSQFRGKKPVLLNLWTVSCPYCHMELEELKLMFPEYKDRLEIVSVSVDRWYPLSYIKKLASDKELPLTVLADQGSTVATLYRVSAVPANYLIDERGVIVRVIMGAIDRERMEKEVDPLLQ